MKFHGLFLVLFSICVVTVASCSVKGNNETIEGKWKVVDWTYTSYVGRSLDKDEKEEVSRVMNDLVLDFKLNGVFSSNRSKEFKSLENKKFKVNEINEVVIEDNYFSFIIRDNKYFFLLMNIIRPLQG